MKLRTVKVWWLDAVESTGQQERLEAIKKLGKGIKMVSVGLVIQDNKHGILLVQDYIAADDQVRETLFIARKMILKVKELS